MVIHTIIITITTMIMAIHTIIITMITIMRMLTITCPKAISRWAA